MRISSPHRVGWSWITLFFLAGTLLGLGIARSGITFDPDLNTIILFSIPIIFVRRLPSLLVVLAVGIVLGAMLGGDIYQKIKSYEYYVGEKVAIVGSVIDDPAYEERGQLEFHIDDVLINGKDLPGKVRVRGFTGALTIRRGDRIMAEGKLQSAFGSRQGSVSFAEISILEPKKSWLEQIRRQFFAGVYNAIPEPQASLGLGFLVGTRSLLPENLTEQLRRIGLTHIVAVSGYNLTILVRFARRFGMKISKHTSVIMALGLILGFLIVAGPSPSIYRAATVTIFSLAAWYYGRRASPIMLLLLSSSVTAMINPLYLWSDLGWWLSFLAFFGILVLAPLIKVRLFGKSEVGWLPEILLETLSAQIMTVPLILVVFGELSIISILSNIIVLPLVPLAMILTFVGGIFGAFAAGIVGWVSWPAVLVLSFITEIAAVLSKPSWSFVEFKISSLGAGIIYAITILICALLYRHAKQNKLPVFEKSVVE